MTSRVDWHGDEWLERDFEPAVTLGLKRAAIVLQSEMAKKMGTGGGGVARKTKKGRNVYFSAPPGAYPGVRTGTLRRSITFNLVGELGDRKAQVRTVRVGTNIKYGKWLEQGTSRMPARPWAERTMRLSSDRLSREFTRTVTASLRTAAARRLGDSR